MPQFKYKGITFAEGWNGTFEQFKAEFGNVWVFKTLEPKKKLAELKKVFNELNDFNKKQAKDQKQ